MANYVNENSFLDWYQKNAKDPMPRDKILNKVFEQYCRTHEEVFVLSAEESLSGEEVNYPFKFENIGCCGASTIYLYF